MKKYVLFINKVDFRQKDPIHGSNTPVFCQYLSSEIENERGIFC